MQLSSCLPDLVDLFRYIGLGLAEESWMSSLNQRESNAEGFVRLLTSTIRFSSQK
jgi:hypothetical protein